MLLYSPPPLVHSDPMPGLISLTDASDISNSTPYEPLRPNMSLCKILPDLWSMFMNSPPPLVHSDPMSCKIYLMAAPDISTLPSMIQFEPVWNFTRSLVYVYEFPTPSGPLWSNVLQDLSDGCAWHFKLYPLWPPQAQYEPERNFTRSLVYIYEISTPSGPLYAKLA